MEQSSSWEAKSSSANPKILLILQYPKIHYRIHNFQPSLPIRIKINPFHVFSFHFL